MWGKFPVVRLTSRCISTGSVQTCLSSISHSQAVTKPSNSVQNHAKQSLTDCTASSFGF